MKSKKKNTRPSAEELEKRELRFLWIVGSAVLIVLMGLACALRHTSPATLAATAVIVLIGAGAYALIEKFGDHLWDRL